MYPKGFETAGIADAAPERLGIHAKILGTIWAEYGDEPEYLNSYVKALRKKIEDDPACPEYILSAPGFDIASTTLLPQRPRRRCAARMTLRAISRLD